MPNNGQIDWPGIRAAAVTIGVREAARRAAIALPAEEQNRFVERVLKRSSREGWIQAKAAAAAQPLTVQQSKPLSANVRNGSDSLVEYLADDAKETKISLSKGLRKAAKTVEESEGTAILANADKVKHIAGAASMIHGWEDRKNSGLTLNLAVMQMQ